MIEKNWPTVTANEDSYRIGGESQQSKCLSAMARRGEMAWTTPTPWQQEESLDSWEARKAKNKAKGYNGNGQGTPLDMQVKQLHGQAAPASSSTGGSRQGLWATPRSGKTTDENPETWAKRQQQGDVATMPLTAQVKQWATPQASDPEHSGPNQRDSSGRPALPAQAMQWGTPTARDHKSGRGNNERDYKELTPMVERMEQWGSPRTGIRGETHFSYDRGKHNIEEQAGASIKGGGKLNPRWVETLMGLPIGWTRPSCSSPVTIERTNCDSSATELCRRPQSGLSEFLLAS